MENYKTYKGKQEKIQVTFGLMDFLVPYQKHNPSKKNDKMNFIGILKTLL